MSDFDLRKFLAEQKAPKEENIQEVEVNEEELDELRPGYAVGEMSPENNALLKALETLASKAGAAGKKVAAWAKDNIEVGKMSDAMKEEEGEVHEGDMDESVVAGVAALIGGSIAAGKVLDYIADKYPEAVKKFMKATDGAVRGSGKSGSGGSYITQEGEELDEVVDPVTVGAGVAALFGGAAGLSHLMDKLEAGDFGDKGKKLAMGLRKAGKAAGDVTQQRGVSEEELKENAFKSSIKDILNS